MESSGPKVKHFQQFTGKRLRWSHFLSLQLSLLQCKCFPINCVKFFRIKKNIFTRKNPYLHWSSVKPWKFKEQMAKWLLYFTYNMENKSFFLSWCFDSWKSKKKKKIKIIIEKEINLFKLHLRFPDPWALKTILPNTVSIMLLSR